jgi:hypothetical protein
MSSSPAFHTPTPSPVQYQHLQQARERAVRSLRDSAPMRRTHASSSRQARGEARADAAEPVRARAPQSREPALPVGQPALPAAETALPARPGIGELEGGPGRVACPAPVTPRTPSRLRSVYGEVRDVLLMAIGIDGDDDDYECGRG